MGTHMTNEDSNQSNGCRISKVTPKYPVANKGTIVLPREFDSRVAIAETNGDLLQRLDWLRARAHNMESFAIIVNWKTKDSQLFDTGMRFETLALDLALLQARMTELINNKGG